MKITVFATHEEVSARIAGEIAELVATKPDAVLCLAAGHTSLETFAQLAALRESGRADFTRVRVIGLDEWVGTAREDDGSCAGFMWKNCFTPLGLREDQVRMFDGAADLAQECERMEAHLRQVGPIDYLYLGMGMNGHLALNEPGTPFTLRSHVAVLDETTKSVGQKYFAEQVTLSSGVTLGMQNIAESRRVVLMVSGEKKAPIVQTLVRTPPTEGVPASFLKTLPEAELYLDAPAASLLTLEETENKE